MLSKKIHKNLNHEILADRNYAQILIKITPSTKKFEEAKKIVESLTIQIVEMEYLSTNSILIKLNVRETRDVILKLAEHGFINIEGIDACS
jgi:hypothetical protein